MHLARIVYTTLHKNDFAIAYLQSSYYHIHVLKYVTYDYFMKKVIADSKLNSHFFHHKAYQTIIQKVIRRLLPRAVQAMAFWEDLVKIH